MHIRVLRIFVPALLIFSAVFCAAQSPTKEETIQWLETHTFPKLEVGFTQVGIRVPVHWSTSNETGEITYKAWGLFKFGKMTSITVATGKTVDGNNRVIGTYPIILIKGPGCKVSDGETDCTLTGGTLEFSASTPPQDIERYAKALRHLAELNGATLAKDDIF